VPQPILAILCAIAVCQIAIFSTTVYLHRCCAHKAVTVKPWVRFSFRLLLWLTTGVKPREWAAVHRKHHAFTDVPGDPHSPLLLGLWRVELTNALLYRKVARDGVTVDRYARDLAPDRLDRVLFDHAFLGLGLGIGILCLALGWEWGLIASAIHAVSYLLLNGAVNAFGHVTGKQPYDNTAHNLQSLALLAAGEGLHNNHHAAPTSANLALNPREIDPGWLLIQMLVKFHLATVRLDAPVFKGAQGAVSVS
jgi:stearoyl-CoA desaturase (delta-9 desaturase)